MGAPDPRLQAARAHGPNEKFHLPNFFNGIRASLHYLYLLGEINA
jgi:acetylornithine deacetylase/succinyl-diaminopimelate desuccinylase-like protein